MNQEEIKDNLKEEECCCNGGCCSNKNEAEKECHCHEENKEEKKLFKKKNKENKELEEAKKTILELQSKLMYTQADNINYRKRKDEETTNMLKYANQSLLLELVEMIENLDRAANTKAESEESKKIQTGVKMVSDQFKNILKNYGVVEIEALGYPFDPDYMEAMMVESNPDKPNEMVLEVLMKGYKYKDRVLKHAVVKVNQVEESTDKENINEN